MAKYAMWFESKVPISSFIDIERIDGALSDRVWETSSALRSNHAHCLWLSEGQAEVTLLESQWKVRGPALLWMPASTARLVRLKAGAQAWLMSVMDDALHRAIQSHEYAPLLSAIVGQLISVDEKLSEQCEAGHLMTQMYEELRGDHAASAAVVSSYLCVLLVWLWRLGGAERTTEPLREGSSVTFQRFMRLLELNFREHWTISQYADALGMTERSLHIACRRSSDKTPLGLVHGRLFQEACRRLEQSPLSIAQIAYGLGFNCPAHFSRFFKRQAGETAGNYRLRVQRQLSVSQAFSSWP